MYFKIISICGVISVISILYLLTQTLIHTSKHLSPINAVQITLLIVVCLFAVLFWYISKTEKIKENIFYLNMVFNLNPNVCLQPETAIFILLFWEEDCIVTIKRQTLSFIIRRGVVICSVIIVTTLRKQIQVNC